MKVSPTVTVLLSIINQSIYLVYAFTPSSYNHESLRIHHHHVHLNSKSIATKANQQDRARSFSTKLYSGLPIDEDIQKQLAKARALLEKTKAKLAEEEEETSQNKAKVVTESSSVDDETKERKEKIKRESVIKTKSEETGLITTDGELMAALAEEEDWEIKSLMDVFQSESKNGRHDDIDNGLASRDVAASIFNLRLKMQDGDYKRIFDKRNRFIGEDN